MKKAITTFIRNYGVLIKEDESMSYIDLMMDSHFCVTWEDKDYYIPVDHSDYNRNEDYLLIMDYLESIKFE